MHAALAAFLPETEAIPTERSDRAPFISSAVSSGDEPSCPGHRM